MAAITANGSKFYWNDDGETSPADVEIGQIISITGPSVSVATIETTDLQDTAKTFIAGMYDGGEVAIEVSYDPDTASSPDSNHTDMTADILAGQAGYWKVEWSDGNYVHGSGIITSFSSTASIDDKLTASFTIKVSGAVTFIVAQ
jgi:predicted secreted protein